MMNNNNNNMNHKNQKNKQKKNKKKEKKEEERRSSITVKDKNKSLHRFIPLMSALVEGLALFFLTVMLGGVVPEDPAPPEPPEPAPDMFISM